jgi:glycosyltransferase involved in cell wall biosynthesis
MSNDETAIIIRQICIEYNSRNIKFIEFDKNEGAGNARNTGLRHASGNYVSFIDGDDWVDTNYYKTMLTDIKQEDADIAVSGILTEYDNVCGSVRRYHYPVRNIISGSFALRLLSRANSNDVYITPFDQMHIINIINAFFERTRYSNSKEIYRVFF